MKLLLDMNISPDLCPVLAAAGFETVHWSAIGDSKASDIQLLARAADSGFVLVSHDLDFSAILSATKAHGPSVIQVRTEDVLSESFSRLLIASLEQFSSEIQAGAVIVIDEHRSRARVLPIL